MALEFQCECGAKLEPFAADNVISVPMCGRCYDVAYSDGRESLEDELSSVRNDLANMVEQNELLQQEISGHED